MTKRALIVGLLAFLASFATSAVAQTTDSGSITRAGAVALIVEGNPQMKARLGQVIGHMPPMSLFKDVNQKEWYAPYIEVAFEFGIVTGDALKPTFRPGDVLTDDEAIMIAARYRSLSDPILASQLMAAGDDYEKILTAATLGSLNAGMHVPFPIKLGYGIERSDLFAMMETMGMSNPRMIAVTHKPAPVAPPAPVIAARPAQILTQPRPTTTPTYTHPPVRQVQPTRQVVTQPTPSRVVAQVSDTPAPSAKSFAISMPSLGVSDLTITHPANPTTKDGLLAPLKYGVGHLFSYPGGGGKILVYGHSSSYSWDVSNYTKIFRQINKLNIGDKVYVTYGGKVHAYQVTFKQAVPANDMSAYQGGGSEELILYTCWPPDSIDQRYLVHAKPIAEVAAH